MNNTSINDIQDPSIRLNNSNISNIQNSNNSNIPGNENLSLENVKKQLEERRPQLDNLVNAASKEKSDIKLIAGIIAGAAIIASIVLFTLASSVGIALVCEILLILWIAVAVIDTLLILCAGKSHDKEIQEINNILQAWLNSITHQLFTLDIRRITSSTTLLNTKCGFRSSTHGK